jgi:predicted  nucleic acid-binding Zn-ribbon protein
MKHKCNRCGLRFDEEAHLRPGPVLCPQHMTEALLGESEDVIFDAVSEFEMVRRGELSMSATEEDDYSEESGPEIDYPDRGEAA